MSAAVLGIALVGLVNLHTTSIEGTAKADDIGRAAEIARQRADQLASAPVTVLAACGNATTPFDTSTPQGCRASFGPGSAFANDKLGACTQLVSSDATPNGSGVLPIAPSTEPNPYRIDVLLSGHPSGSTGLAQVHVWVCWRDGSGMVNEVHTTRTRVAGMW